MIGLVGVFFRSVLVAVGVEINLVELIMFCVTSASLCNLWNGEKLEVFQPEQRLRREICYLHICLFYAWNF